MNKDEGDTGTRSDKHLHEKTEGGIAFWTRPTIRRLNNAETDGKKVAGSETELSWVGPS